MATVTEIGPGPNPTHIPGGIGAAVPRIDGRLKVTGAARYGSDVAVQSPAYAYFHTSAIAVGRIRVIDEAEARAVPGVLDVLTWQNMAGQVEPLPLFNAGGLALTSIMPLQSPDVHHDGEVLAVVLADSFEAAREASYRLRITYDARTPTATFGDKGLEAESMAGSYFDDITVGDAEGAFAAAPVRLDRRYATPTQHHNAMELFTTTAVWEGNELTLHEPCQYMVGNQFGMAAQLRLDPARVRIVSSYVGGGFGAKGGVTPRTALIAIAARRLGRPVKFVSTRDQAFNLATYRAETRHRVRIAADASGRLLAYLHDGEELTSRPDTFVTGTEAVARMYTAPAIATRVTAQHADRDTPGYMRSPAEVPYFFALESAMDELAVELGMDPVELRRVNDSRVEPVRGLPWSSRSLMPCFDAAAAAFGWAGRDPRPGSMTDGDWLVGWGCASAFYPATIAPSFARVTLDSAGAGIDALVEVAGHELGTGAYTVYAQVAADRLGLPIERVEVRMGDSRLPPAPLAGGSNNAASISNAVAMGCAQIRDRIAAAAVADAESPLAGRDAATLMLASGALTAPDGAVERLVDALARLGGAVEAMVGNEPATVPPGALARLRTGGIALGGGLGGTDAAKAAFGANFLEVRVHRRTREARVTRMVGAFAAGTILNPMTARSQLLGGMIWGVGAALHEATEIDRRTARYTNDNLAEYLIPVNADIPAVEVILVPETDTQVNPLGIKGVGELGNVGVNAAVCNAIFHATGIRIRDLPVRIEKLLV